MLNFYLTFWKKLKENGGPALTSRLRSPNYVTCEYVITICREMNFIDFGSISTVCRSINYKRLQNLGLNEAEIVPNGQWNDKIMNSN